MEVNVILLEAGMKTLLRRKASVTGWGISQEREGKPLVMHQDAESRAGTCSRPQRRDRQQGIGWEGC